MNWSITIMKLMWNDPQQRRLGWWNLLRSFSERAGGSFFNETLDFLSDCFCSLMILLRSLHLLDLICFLEMIEKLCEACQVIRLSRLPSDLEKKEELTAHRWWRRGFAKPPNDLFLLRFRKHFSDWRLIWVLESLKSFPHEQIGVFTIRSKTF